VYNIAENQLERSREVTRRSRFHTNMSFGSALWHNAYLAKIAKMKTDFEQNNWNMVTVDELPKNDQLWITEYIK